MKVKLADLVADLSFSACKCKADPVNSVSDKSAVGPSYISYEKFN